MPIFKSATRQGLTRIALVELPVIHQGLVVLFQHQIGGRQLVDGHRHIGGARIILNEAQQAIHLFLIASLRAFAERPLVKGVIQGLAPFVDDFRVIGFGLVEMPQHELAVARPQVGVGQIGRVGGAADGEKALPLRQRLFVTHAVHIEITEIVIHHGVFGRRNGFRPRRERLVARQGRIRLVQLPRALARPKHRAGRQRFVGQHLRRRHERRIGQRVFAATERFHAAVEQQVLLGLLQLVRQRLQFLDGGQRLRVMAVAAVRAQHIFVNLAAVSRLRIGFEEVGKDRDRLLVGSQAQFVAQLRIVIHRVFLHDRIEFQTGSVAERIHRKLLLPALHVAISQMVIRALRQFAVLIHAQHAQEIMRSRIIDLTFIINVAQDIVAVLVRTLGRAVEIELHIGQRPVVVAELVIRFADQTRHLGLTFG